MSGIRVGLLILVLAGLVIFTVQNLSPVLPFSFLFGRTLAMPLAFWLLVAIALGSVTALVLSGLMRFGPPGNRPQKRRSPSAGFRPAAPSGPTAGRTSQSDRFAANPNQTVMQDNTTQLQDEVEPRFGPRWMSNWGWRSSDTNASDRRANDDSDWGSPTKEEWEDWEDYETPNEPDRTRRVVEPRSPTPQPEIRDMPRDYDDQRPDTVYRAGSIYSYSYRRSAAQPEDVYGEAQPETQASEDELESRQNEYSPNSYQDSYSTGRDWQENYSSNNYPDEDEDNWVESDASEPPPADDPTPVYDAEYRVITPPYRDLTEDEADEVDDEDDPYRDMPFEPIVEADRGDRDDAFNLADEPDPTSDEVEVWDDWDDWEPSNSPQESRDETDWSSDSDRDLQR
jgi:hypothetical protein